MKYVFFLVYFNKFWNYFFASKFALQTDIVLNLIRTDAKWNISKYIHISFGKKSCYKSWNFIFKIPVKARDFFWNNRETRLFHKMVRNKCNYDLMCLYTLIYASFWIFFSACISIPGHDLGYRVSRRRVWIWYRNLVIPSIERRFDKR